MVFNLFNFTITFEKRQKTAKDIEKCIYLQQIEEEIIQRRVDMIYKSGYFL